MNTRRTFRFLLWIPALYACWVGMEAIHEAGHVLAAIAGGGRVARVVLPPLGFSRTDVSFNPKPRLEEWGGPVGGSVFPLLAWAVSCLAPGRFERLRRALQLFAGFCLIANGIYLGIGWIDRTGDAGDLLRHGTPPWHMVAFGTAATGSGIYLWHRLGESPRARVSPV